MQINGGVARGATKRPAQTTKGGAVRLERPSEAALRCVPSEKQKRADLGWVLLASLKCLRRPV
jgi:hypothetical protein